MKPLMWSPEKRDSATLVEFDKNPRILSKQQEIDLTKSIEKFGLVEKPVININGTILAGHQRLKVFRKLFGDSVIDVIAPNRSLTDKEQEEYLIRSNKNTGGWDFEMLDSEFEKDDLIDFGFGEHELNFDDSEIEEQEDIVLSEVYKLKIEFPDKQTMQDTYNEMNRLGYDCDVVHR